MGKANLSDDALGMFPSECNTGVYYGFVQIDAPQSTVYPMVMSLGWNPYYQNDKRSAVKKIKCPRASRVWVAK
jgi:riboflavin kinase